MKGSPRRRLWLAAILVVTGELVLLVGAGRRVARPLPLVPPPPPPTCTLSAAAASDWPSRARAADWSNPSDDPAGTPVGVVRLDPGPSTTERVVGPFVVRWSKEQSEYPGVARRFEPAVMVEIAAAACAGEPLRFLATPRSPLLIDGDEGRGVFKVRHCFSPFSWSPDRRPAAAPYGHMRDNEYGYADVCPPGSLRQFSAAVRRFRIVPLSPSLRALSRTGATTAALVGALFAVLSLSGLWRAHRYFRRGGIAGYREGRGDGRGRVLPDDGSPPVLAPGAEAGPVLFEVGDAAPQASFREAGLREAIEVVQGTRAEVERRHRWILIAVIAAGALSAALSVAVIFGGQ